MPVTIPTAEFVGAITDVLPFANPDKDDLVLHAIQLGWDGDLFTAAATDVLRIAISQWQPDDDPDEDDVQDDLLTEWGANSDEVWSIVLPYDAASHLAKTYKLGAKQGRTPLTLTHTSDGLQVARSSWFRSTAITTITPGVEVEYPDLFAALAKLDRVTDVRAVAFTAAQLADFKHVRPRGPLELTFTGEETPALVQIGERFTGAVLPVRRPSANRRLAAVA